ncbi:MAG: hypothetical protein PT944_04390 [Actinomycetaceae bacterium]|nr:hypothetical protein [Arcanobacterium sp.]MDD7687140.1 hypothetical protein [Actinomycetaceae bacterium]MDY5273195.1 hypothetical protein [Arcanobacterium sp.]
MHNTGTDSALGGSPAHMTTAGASFCAAPDPLLDLCISPAAPDLYSPVRTLCCARRTADGELAAGHEDPDYSRSFRNHPSNFGKNKR